MSQKKLLNIQRMPPHKFYLNIEQKQSSCYCTYINA